MWNVEKPPVIPALAVPRQANRKASPGDAALRGSKKPRPVCNGPDMPTSIWSLVVRSSTEPFLLRKANDDRHQSIGASQNRPQEGRVLRLSIRMAKVAPDLNAEEMTGASTSDKALLRGLSRMKGNLHVRFLGGPERVTAQVYPVESKNFCRDGPIGTAASGS